MDDLLSHVTCFPLSEGLIFCRAVDVVASCVANVAKQHGFPSEARMYKWYVRTKTMHTPFPTQTAVFEKQTVLQECVYNITPIYDSIICDFDIMGISISSRKFTG